MGDEYICVNGAIPEIVGHEPFAQWPYSGSHINNNQPLTGPYFQTGRVSTE
jgi:hypothetical protein